MPETGKSGGRSGLSVADVNTAGSSFSVCGSAAEGEAGLCAMLNAEAGFAMAPAWAKGKGRISFRKVSGSAGL